MIYFGFHFFFLAALSLAAIFIHLGNEIVNKKETNKEMDAELDSVGAFTYKYHSVLDTQNYTKLLQITFKILLA